MLARWLSQPLFLSSGSIQAAQDGAQQEARVRALLQIEMLCWLQRLTGYMALFYYMVETCRECFCPPF